MRMRTRGRSCAVLPEFPIFTAESPAPSYPGPDPRPMNEFPRRPPHAPILGPGLKVPRRPPHAPIPGPGLKVPRRSV